MNAFEEQQSASVGARAKRPLPVVFESGTMFAAEGLPERLGYAAESSSYALELIAGRIYVRGATSLIDRPARYQQ